MTEQPQATSPLFRNGMSGHESRNANTHVWLTPPRILSDLGIFDLDPCASINQPWDTATRHLTVNDNGLLAAWHPSEFVWMNPPYGTQVWTWLERLARHPAGGIALIFARTETVGFVNQVWGKASSLRFLHGRIRFHHPDGSPGAGSAGAPSVLVGYGLEASRRLEASALPGTYVSAWGREEA